jgi:hypothetical protein
VADVHEGPASGGVPVGEGQRPSRIVMPGQGEGRGQKVATVDVEKGQRPAAGAKTVDAGPPSGPPMTSLPPAPPTSQQAEAVAAPPPAKTSPHAKNPPKGK